MKCSDQLIKLQFSAASDAQPFSWQLMQPAGVQLSHGTVQGLHAIKTKKTLGLKCRPDAFKAHGTCAMHGLARPTIKGRCRLAVKTTYDWHYHNTVNNVVVCIRNITTVQLALKK